MPHSQEKTNRTPSIFLLMGLIAVVPFLSKKLGFMFDIIDAESASHPFFLMACTLLAFAIFGTITYVAGDVFKTTNKEYFDEK
jgi:ABC-type phosphate transport system permease subunit